MRVSHPKFHETSTDEHRANNMSENGRIIVFCRACAVYNKEQLTPVKLLNDDRYVLITEYNDLGSNRFYDPRSNKTFKFDHLRKDATDYEVCIIDECSRL